MRHIFLSASVPLPERNSVYFDTADVFLIREAIRSLIEVIIPVGAITFGGHPAITPLVSLYLDNTGYSKERVTIFQSEFFSRPTGRKVLDFADIRYTPSVYGEIAPSLTLMRQQMIGSQKFDAAVLIGGMEGIDEELKIFKQYHPTALILPVPSTGAAAQMVYYSGNFPAEIEKEISFASMFRRHLLPPPKIISKSN